MFKNGYRPRQIYDPNVHPEMVFNSLSTGISLVGVAGELGIGKKTIYEWIERYPELREAADAGLARGQLMWEKRSMQASDPDYNPTTFIFTMKSRYHVKDNDSAPITINIGADTDKQKFQQVIDQVLQNPQLP